MEICLLALALVVLIQWAVMIVLMIKLRRALQGHVAKIKRVLPCLKELLESKVPSFPISTS